MTFTKTEFVRRVRALIAEARTIDRGITKGMKVEIGTRTIPVYTATVPTYAEAWPDHDDLRDFAYLSDPVSQLARIGLLEERTVVHVYLATTGMWGELYTTITGWVGTSSEEPVLLSVPGKKIDPSPYRAEVPDEWFDDAHSRR